MIEPIYRSLADLAPRPPLYIERDSRGFAATIGASTLYGDNVPTPETFGDFQRAFEDLVVVYRCASLNTDAVTAGVLRFYRPTGSGEREEIIDPMHPLLRLWTEPNGRVSGHRLLWRHQLSKELTGNGYMEIARLGPRRPALQLWNLNAAHMSIDADRREGVKSYVYKPGSEDAVRFAREEVWHDLFPGLTDELYGQPPLRAAKSHMVADRLLEQAMLGLLKSGLRISGVLTVDPGATAEQLKLVADQAQEFHGGVMKWFRTLVIPGGRKFQPLTMKPEEFGAKELRLWNAGQIMRAFGVWPLIFGEVNESATRENATTQSILHHFLTVAPRGKALAQEITRLIPMLRIPGTEGVTAEMDYSEAWAVRQLALEEAEAKSALLERGVFDINEVREIAGYEPVAWGGYFWGQSSLRMLAGPDGPIAAEQPQASPEPKGAPTVRAVALLNEARRLLATVAEAGDLREAA